MYSLGGSVSPFKHRLTIERYVQAMFFIGNKSEMKKFETEASLFRISIFTFRILKLQPPVFITRRNETVG